MKEYQRLSHTRWDCKYHVVFIVDHKVKTTGFSRSALAAKICCARGGAAWTTDMAAIRYFRLSTTLCG
jgi:hypothetical protein